MMQHGHLSLFAMKMAIVESPAVVPRIVLLMIDMGWVVV